MHLVWLPWLVPTLLLANGIFSFALGYRSKRSIYVMATQPSTPQTAPAVMSEGERILVRPDLGLFAENETLRDALAKAEATIAETEHSLRETKAALARSEARILDGERVKQPLTRSVFAPRARQVEPR